MAEFKVGERVANLVWGMGTVMSVIDNVNHPVGVTFDAVLPEVDRQRIGMFTKEGNYSLTNVDKTYTIHKLTEIEMNREQKKANKNEQNLVTTHKNFMEALLRGDTLKDGDHEWKLDLDTGDLLVKGCGNMGYPVHAYGVYIKPKTININGFIVPEPERKPLERYTSYFLVDITARPTANIHYKWCDGEIDTRCLEAGLIHLTREAADLHIKALLSFTKI